MPCFVVRSRTFDKRLKETKDLFEKWKQLTDTKNQDVSSDQLRQYTRGADFVQCCQR